MSKRIHRPSVEFFERQFRGQVQRGEHALNPFETLALDYLKGDILDLGSGLGNLTLEAARRGHNVTAVDASPTAVERLIGEAHREKLPVTVVRAAIEHWNFNRAFDTIVAIGLLMFFRQTQAVRVLQRIQSHVRPGGRAIVNVLIEGTTFLDMFDPHNHYLFKPNELEHCFADWTILYTRDETFPAPKDTLKRFSTLIASKQSGGT